MKTKGYVIRVFKKSTLRDKINSDFIYPTNHDAVLRILKSRREMKTAEADEVIFTTSTLAQMTNSNSDVGSDVASSLSLQIEKDKYEKLDGADVAEAANLTRKVYLKKKEDYDIINEIVSAI